MRLEPAPMVYGVDFGMSTSSLAVLDDDGHFRLVADPALPVGSAHSVPTAVFFDKPSERLLVGREAVNLKSQRDDAYADNFKRDVKVDPRPFTLADRSFGVVDLVAAVLGFLRAGAREIDSRNPAATVLTVPVGWEAGRRQLMIDAAVAAGFPADSLYLVEEPVAAIEYARSVEMAADDETVLVYDLGGGTFDCAVSTPTRSAQRSIRLTNSRLFGGRDFDYKVLEEVRRRFPAEVNAVIGGDGGPGDPSRRLRLLESCESLKMRLSDTDPVSEPLTELGPNVDVLITRVEFETLIRSQIADTILCCQKMLSEIGLEWNDVDAVIAVGGSSRIPLVERELEAVAPGRVRATADRDTAVARGAALLARKQAARIVAKRRLRQRELTPPDIWVPQAVPEEPQTVEVGQYKKFPRRLLRWTWGTLAPAAAGAVGLAALHWRWLGFGTVIALVLAAAASTGWLTAKADKEPNAAVLTFFTTGVLGLLLIVVGAIYGYREIFEHRGGYWLVCGWAIATGVVSWVCAGFSLDADEQSTAIRNANKTADEDQRVIERIAGRQWFGLSEDPPDFMAPLFALPALHGFEFSTSTRTANINYALAAGSRVLLVAVLSGADDRPDLDAAAASWRGRLAGRETVVKTIFVIRGYELPVLSFNQQFAMTTMMTTTFAFVDTVGHWLDHDNRIVLPTIKSLLGGAPVR